MRSGTKRGCGDGCTRPCLTASTTRTGSAGRGPRSTRRRWRPPGGRKASPDPPNRDKKGSERHLVVGRNGVPLAVTHAAANVHDFRVLEEARKAARRQGLRLPALRRGLAQAGDKGAHLRAGGGRSEREAGCHRRVVEQTPSWPNRYWRCTMKLDVPAQEEMIGMLRQAGDSIWAEIERRQRQ